MAAEGDALYKAGQYQEAADAFTQAIRINDKDGDAYRKRGLCWNGLRDYNRAALDFAVAPTLNGRDARAFNGWEIAV